MDYCVAQHECAENDRPALADLQADFADSKAQKAYTTATHKSLPALQLVDAVTVGKSAGNLCTSLDHNRDGYVDRDEFHHGWRFCSEPIVNKVTARLYREMDAVARIRGMGSWAIKTEHLSQIGSRRAEAQFRANLTLLALQWAGSEFGRTDRDYNEYLSMAELRERLRSARSTDETRALLHMVNNYRHYQNQRYDTTDGAGISTGDIMNAHKMARGMVYLVNQEHVAPEVKSI